MTRKVEKCKLLEPKVLRNTIENKVLSVKNFRNKNDTLIRYSN